MQGAGCRWELRKLRQEGDGGEDISRTIGEWIP